MSHSVQLIAHVLTTECDNNTKRRKQ